MNEYPIYSYWLTFEIGLGLILTSKISGPNGIDDLFQHAFFTTIDWDKLKQKLQDPPFKPTVVNDEAFYFDPSFTSKTPKGKFFFLNNVLIDVFVICLKKTRRRRVLLE